MNLYDRIPANLSAAQRERTECELSRMACMMVDWFADRAFTCPDSLPGTIEAYKGLVVARAHNAARELTLAVELPRELLDEVARRAAERGVTRDEMLRVLATKQMEARGLAS